MTIPRRDIIYVILQFLLLLFWIFDLDRMEFQISENLHSLGLVIAVAGFLLAAIALWQIRAAISPFPSPRQGAKLVTQRAFAFARHPIYSGILFMAFGLSVYFGSGYKLLISLVLYLLFFLKSRYEEKRLLESFPEYALYRKNTGRFFPKFKGRI